MRDQLLSLTSDQADALTAETEMYLAREAFRIDRQAVRLVAETDMFLYCQSPEDGRSS